MSKWPCGAVQTYKWGPAVILTDDEALMDSQQLSDINPILIYCWPSVCDAGPTIKQHWEIVSCKLGWDQWSVSLHVHECCGSRACLQLVSDSTSWSHADHSSSQLTVCLLTYAASTSGEICFVPSNQTRRSLCWNVLKRLATHHMQTTQLEEGMQLFYATLGIDH